MPNAPTTSQTKKKRQTKKKPAQPSTPMDDVQDDDEDYVPMTREQAALELVGARVQFWRNRTKGVPPWAGLITGISEHPGYVHVTYFHDPGRDIEGMGRDTTDYCLDVKLVEDRAEAAPAEPHCILIIEA